MRLEVLFTEDCVLVAQTNAGVPAHCNCIVQFALPSYPCPQRVMPSRDWPGPSSTRLFPSLFSSPVCPASSHASTSSGTVHPIAETTATAHTLRSLNARVPASLNKQHSLPLLPSSQPVRSLLTAAAACSRTLTDHSLVPSAHCATMSLQSRNQPATFPGLPIREIVDTCRGFLCTISEEDILHPTAPRAQAIYSFWMTSILGLNMDDIVKASEAQLDLMDNPVRANHLAGCMRANGGLQDIYREAMYIGVFQMAMFDASSPLLPPTY